MEARETVIETEARLDALRWAGMSPEAVEAAREAAYEYLDASGIRIDEVTALECDLPVKITPRP